MADSSVIFDKASVLGLLTSKLSGNSYAQTTLVANKAEYNPQILEPTFTHGWGLAHRPSGGLGGHFWVIGNGSGISYQYVGDVNGSPLFQDEIGEMTVPPGPDGAQGSPTGTAFNQSSSFVITQDHPNGAITAPTKFFFASINGIISAWTERKNADGTFDWPLESITVIDGNAEAKGEYNSIYFGVATDKAGNYLYAADVSDNHRIQVFDSNFKDITANRFANPFVGEEGLQLGGFAPFNVQTLTNKDGKESVFVTYATVREAPPPSSVFFAAPPRLDAPPPASKLAEFDTDGNLIRVWEDNGLLQAAYGVAYAPDNFGGLSDTLLVGNFNTGTVVAFDPNTHTAIDYLRDDTGKVLVADGIWGMLFGNGASLGDTDSLYYAAGANNNTDGVFGHIRWDGSPLLPKDAPIADFTQIADRLLALNPSIFGGDGDDVLYGTIGSAFFEAGKGNNTMYGGKGDSVLVATDGNNSAYGGGGDDLFYLGNGNNSMYGGQGSGIFMTGDGNNTIYGSTERNLAILGNGNNNVYTGSGTNIIMTGNGNNGIYASDERDYIYTGAGNDTIYAGQGDDIISSGTGNDTVHIGSGTNLLILDKGEGSATVWNFKDNDSISFGASVKKADSITTQLFGSDTQVFAGGDLLATLLNTQGNIQFV